MNIQVTLNGEAKSLPAGLNLKALLEHLELPEKGVGIEHNGQMVLRTEWEGTLLAEGDGLEIVKFVGGG